MVTTVAEPARPGIYEQIRSQLAEESKRGLVAVKDQGNTVKITINNKGLFRSGSAVVDKGFHSLIDKIGTALRDARGPILVTGHTDSVPIRTLRFPSNWHLSVARADAVRALLAGSLGEKSSLVAEGRADTEPLAANDTAEGREQNRRIEIEVPRQ